MTLSSCDAALSSQHDVIMLDLDGVVYRGGDAVPYAVESLSAAASAGAHLAYLTNNASRPPGTVVSHLASLGLPGVTAGDVVTSAQAIARVIAAELPPESVVLVIGGEGLHLALSSVGLRSTSTRSDQPVAVVQGYDASLGWRDLAEAAYAVEAGLPWYVSNTDETIPTADGVAPGNGLLVHAVAVASGARPRAIAGKPYAPLFDETIQRLKPRAPLMVGDRLDTDIEGAVRAGLRSLAVLTGVSTLADVVAAGAESRPDFIGDDLRVLAVAHPPVHVDGSTAVCGSARVEVRDGVVSSVGAAERLHLLRAAVELAWAVGDASGRDVALDATIRA